MMDSRRFVAFWHGPVTNGGLPMFLASSDLPITSHRGPTRPRSRPRPRFQPSPPELAEERIAPGSLSGVLALDANARKSAGPAALGALDPAPADIIAIVPFFEGGVGPGLPGITKPADVLTSLTVTSSTIRATFANPSNVPIVVALDSYQKTDDVLLHQVFFDGQHATLAPGQTVTLEVLRPPCFQGDCYLGGEMPTLVPFGQHPGIDLLGFALAHGSFDADPCQLVVDPQDRMTGGGSVFTADGLRVTHGFELHCDITQAPNNLEINWGGNQFHLESLTSNQCFLDSDVGSPHPPSADFNTMVGTGVGRYNGQPGYTIAFVLTDAGEPGVSDTASYIIRDPNSNPVLTVSGPVTNGNQQAHD